MERFVEECRRRGLKVNSSKSKDQDDNAQWRGRIRV